ncbi:MAG TPA: molybdopterin molybdenumtransferase MoeA, partial [Methanomicrobiales archaeon]|nr:molybdopterin molybdenumtransferase MoeA [Methanomicrobiales archaeon]
MSLFLQVIPVEKAISIVRSIAPRMETEEISLTDAEGRILARDAPAGIDIPGFDRSIVDGYAVIARDTHGASETIPAMLTLTGRIAMGGGAEREVHPGESVYIPTGGMLPPGADAVVMIENTERIQDDVLIMRPAAAGENVLKRGEDFTA